MELEALLRDVLDEPLPDPELPPGRPAAVLVPVLAGSEPSLLFTRRTELVGSHKGEVSFPGGVRDPETEPLLSTALRETEEELGIPATAFEVVGALPPTPTFVSGFVIAAFVGLLAERPNIRPNPAEIAEVLEIPLATLRAVEREVPVPGGPHATMFSYEASGHVVWGATGRILHSLLERLTKGGWR